MNFSAYFDDEHVLRRLCHYRVSNSQSRHEQQYLRNISKLAPAPAQPTSFDRMFPPRGQWFRPTPQERHGRGRDEIYELALFRTVIAKLNSAAGKGEQWALDLTAFVALIRERAFATPMVLASPTIIPTEKSPHLYRALAAYPIADRVILTQVTRYLGRRFDEQLVDGVYGQRLGHSTCSRSHHQAVDALVLYRMAHAGMRLRVAEFDLRCFFDCVPHQAVREAIARAVRHSRSRGMEIDPQALAIIEAFLKSYSFAGTAVPGAAAWFEVHGAKGTLDSPTKELTRIWGADPSSTLGIAQGGAPSGLIANLVLDPVDRAVLGGADNPDPDLFYARYLDDIIIVHPDQRRCEEAFERLRTSVQELLLPSHRPRHLKNYELKSKVSGRNLFWGYKSKAPYRWEASWVTKRSVPWVGFLGYQICFDGRLKIRPSSIAKQMSGQVFEVDRVLRLLRQEHSGPGARPFPTRALVSLVCRLSAMVGTAKHGDKFGHGWASGFRLLLTNKHVKSQIQRLDQGRSRQVHRLIRGLRVATGSSLPFGVLRRFRRYSASYVAAFEAPDGVTAPATGGVTWLGGAVPLRKDASTSDVSHATTLGDTK